jgi:hypothetical protein
VGIGVALCFFSSFFLVQPPFLPRGRKRRREDGVRQSYKPYTPREWTAEIGERGDAG